MSTEICDNIKRETNREAKKCYDLEQVKNPTRAHGTWKDVTKQKLVLILDYSTKNIGGVDNIDKCLADYSTKR